MTSPLSFYAKRLELLWKLREYGFYVRMHAYEYLVGDGDRFHALILLEPGLKRALVKTLGEEEIVKVIEKIIAGIDPNIRFETL